MEKFNFKRSSLLLGAAAIVLAASADNYRDVTGEYMKNAAFIPGWQGGLSATADGVAEVYNGAFNLYQVLNDMPAGTYTLSCNAFYRCGNNDFANKNMQGDENRFAFIYINDEMASVQGLFDGHQLWAGAPNNTWEANAAFENGDYENSVIYTLAEPGTLVVGIKNLGGYNDEWCCFDNFKLYGPDGEIALANADFSEGLDVNADCWDMVNSEGKVKTPDVNKGGGVYRKTNASPYNFGQQVDLPAGKYRFSALTFLRYGGAGNYEANIISCKGEWKLQEVPMSPMDWYEANAYTEDDFTTNAYLYASFEEEKPTSLSTSIEMLEENVVYARLLDCWEICEGVYSEMPENETRGTAEGTEIVPAYDVRNVVAGWADSGVERESAAAFVNQPEKYRQYVEFEVTEPCKVWVGFGKDENTPAQYWNPFVDFKLEVLDENAGIANLVNDENAPVEYFNLQGIRVAQPENGLYIVKQGKKATKQVF